MVLGWEGGRRQGEMLTGWVLHFLCLTYSLLINLPILPLLLAILDEQRLALESSGCQELLGRVEQIGLGQEGASLKAIATRQFQASYFCGHLLHQTVSRFWDRDVALFFSSPSSALYIVGVQ